MAQLKLRVKKAGSKHPVTKQLGFVARVQTNGTAEFDDIVKDAGRNTTIPARTTIPDPSNSKNRLERCPDGSSYILTTKITNY